MLICSSWLHIIEKWLGSFCLLCWFDRQRKNWNWKIVHNLQNLNCMSASGGASMNVYFLDGLACTRKSPKGHHSIRWKTYRSVKIYSWLSHVIVLCNDVNFVGTSRIGWTSKLFSYHVAALLDASLGTDVNQINEWKLELKFWSRVTCPELKPLVHRNSYATIHVYAVELVKHLQSFFSVENTW